MFRKLFFTFLVLLVCAQVEAQVDSVQSDTIGIEESHWPNVLNHKGELSKKALKFALANDSFRYYLCIPYSYWIIQKPFVAVDAFDPFTPPEYAIIKKPQNNNLLIFIVLLNVIYLIAIIKLSNERNLFSFVNSLYSSVSAVKYYNDSKTVFNRVNLQLLFVQLLMIALGIALYQNFLTFLPSSTLIRFFILFFSFLGVILLKVFVSWSLEKIFEINKLSVVIMNHTVGINFIATLVMLPVFLVVYLNSGTENSHFLPVFITVIIIISLSIRVFRSFMMLNLSFPYPKVYLLLYFCTVEILPWLIIFKLIANE